MLAWVCDVAKQHQAFSILVNASPNRAQALPSWRYWLDVNGTSHHPMSRYAALWHMMWLKSAILRGLLLLRSFRQYFAEVSELKHDSGVSSLRRSVVMSRLRTPSALPGWVSSKLANNCGWCYADLF